MSSLPLPQEFTLAADKMEDTVEFTLPTGVAAARWIRAVDLLPGAPAIVRSATIYVEVPRPRRAGGTAPERVLAHWLPGPRARADGERSRVPPAGGRPLGVRIHYKKTWQLEGKAMADRSTVGIYFSPGTDARELLSLPVESRRRGRGGPDRDVQPHVADDLQVLALSPDSVPANITVQVEAVRPDGSRAPMIRLNTRADWDRALLVRASADAAARQPDRGEGELRGSGHPVNRVRGDAPRGHRAEARRR